jgi:glycosyltransferase involved in cell wall biosynthesis
MSQRAQLVSVVLPVHNQADHITTVVEQYVQALRRDGLSGELVLVVNACSDDSLRVCRALAEQEPSVRVLDTPAGGWGRAVRLGLAAASGELLCYANSARTSAADLVSLVRYALANPGVVIKPHRRSRESWSRRIGSFLYNAEVRLLFDLPTWDINATPKVFHRDLYRQLDLRSDGDLIDLEFYLACRALGRPIVEVPIYSWHRFGGGSTTTYRSAARLYIGAFRMWRHLRRQ